VRRNRERILKENKETEVAPKTKVEEEEEKQL